MAKNRRKKIEDTNEIALRTVAQATGQPVEPPPLARREKDPEKPPEHAQLSGDQRELGAPRWEVSPSAEMKKQSGPDGFLSGPLK